MATTINSTSYSGETLESIGLPPSRPGILRQGPPPFAKSWLGTVDADPHAPSDVIGVMKLRGSVIPIIDLAYKLGMKSTVANERSAIVVAEVHIMVIGMLVDRVSDILTMPSSQIQPVPEVSASFDKTFCEGIIANENGMICFLNLSKMFKGTEADDLAA